jgi:hypothetical protein
MLSQKKVVLGVVDAVRPVRREVDDAHPDVLLKGGVAGRATMVPTSPVRGRFGPPGA